MRILIVDDEEVIRDGMVHALPWTEYDFHILTPAKSGEEALERIKMEHPDIIITDIMMQGISGLDLVTALDDIDYPKEIIILSGYDEFNYVQEALRKNVSDYLLKTSSPKEILTSVHRARKRLLEVQKSTNGDTGQYDNRLMKKLLLGNYTKTEINQFERKMNRKSHEIYQLIMVDRVIREDQFEQMKKIWNSYLFGHFLIHHDQTLIIVKRESNVHDDYAFQIAQKRMFSIYQQPLLVSDTFSTLESISTIYEEIKSYVYYQWLEPNESFITTSLIKRRQGISHHERFDQYESDCLSILRYGTKEELNDWTNRLIDWLFTHGDATPKTVENYVHHLYFSIVRDVEQTYELDGFSVKKVGSTTQFFHDPVYYLYSLLIDLQHAIQAQNTGPKYISEALLFIEKNLHQSLTLQDVANEVHIHPNYLSEMLRKKQQMTFLEIVTMMRMEKAVKLIVHSNKSIKEIAHLVGYNDRKYFTQLFKKYYHYTPSQYRKRHQILQ